VKPDLNAVWGVSNGAYDQPKFVADAGALGDKYFSTNYHYDATNPETVALRERYQQRFGDPMRTGAVLSYDAVQVVAHAVEQAASTDPQKVRGAIAGAQVTPLTVGHGPIRFAPNGENSNAFPVLMQIRDGRVQQVYPPEKAESRPEYTVAWRP
jgi:branched-chain amino acid transport system substrate-binding protein